MENIHYAVYANDAGIPLLVTRHYNKARDAADALVYNDNSAEIIETSASGIRCIWEGKAK